jgi:hypothetical protein
VNRQALCPMIEALGATHLNTIFLVETSYPGYPQSASDENGPPKQVNCDRRPSNLAYLTTRPTSML